MNPLIFLFAFIVAMVIVFFVRVNIEYRKGLKSGEISKEDTDEDWQDKQW